MTMELIDWISCDAHPSARCDLGIVGGDDAR